MYKYMYRLKCINTHIKAQMYKYMYIDSNV